MSWLLQSKLNEGKGPVVYLCPNNFLIEQTYEQARQFGIPTCQADPELPVTFQNGEQILVTSVQKLFNGLTKFGIDRNSITVRTLLMDDAHACADTIRDACKNISNFDLDGAEIYTSCEPCPMCLASIYWARISKIYYGNTRKDAANIKFDDDFLYQEIPKDIKDRKIPMVQCEHSEALKVFQEWDKKTDKVPY